MTPQRKKQVKKQVVDFAKRWAVIFLHSEGWTISTIHDRHLDALAELAHAKEICPSFRYKIVKIKCTFEV